MKNKKSIVALVFSDLHLNIWSKFNEDNKRTNDGFKVLEKIAGICDKKHIPALFCGDMFHKPENLDQDLGIMVVNFLNKLKRKYKNCRFICIEGNHDLKHVNTVNKYTKGWISLFKDDKQVIVLNSEDPISITNDIRVYGIPYIDHNIGITNKIIEMGLEPEYKNILLLHTDYPGAKDTDGREVDSVENLNINTLNLFDLVLCGHIHKPQRLSKKVYMIGAPIQQRRTDSNCKLGYWKLYSDLSMEFVELKGFPKFIDVNNEADIKEDGNFYTYIPVKSSIKVNTEHKITKQLSKKSLAKKYMREKGIKDKSKKKLLINLLKEAESC